MSLVLSAFTSSPVSLLETTTLSVFLYSVYAYAQYTSFISNLRAPCHGDGPTDYALAYYLQIVYTVNLLDITSKLLGTGGGHL